MMGSHLMCVDVGFISDDCSRCFSGNPTSHWSLIWQKGNPNFDFNVFKVHVQAFLDDLHIQECTISLNTPT